MTPEDAGEELDADASDAEVVDAGLPDAELDASVATPEDARVVTPEDAQVDAGLDCSPPADGVLPRDLRCTGLYESGLELADGLLEYTPAHVLWSDGAEKRRWASVPAGTKIDVRNPDAFVYPEGTKFWKEFSVRGADGVVRRAETRLLQKSADGWLYTSYVWNAAQTEAIQMNNMNGVPSLDVSGSTHIVPTRDQCNECHGGRDDQILGWDAILLGAGATVDRERLASWLEGELPAQNIPGTDVEQAALGYLHANCGISCHNANAAAKARDSGLFLRLEDGELASVQTTDAFRTSMNKAPSPNAKTQDLVPATGWLGIRPGQPERSLVVARQRIRKPPGYSESQMPRIGTRVVDEQGVQLIVDWIEAMPDLDGYPDAAP